jgi:hypothetical protein
MICTRSFALSWNIGTFTIQALLISTVAFPEWNVICTGVVAEPA